MDRSVLARKPMTELKDIAAHLNMRGYQKLRKAELIDAIVDSATGQAAEARAADVGANGGGDVGGDAEASGTSRERTRTRTRERGGASDREPEGRSAPDADDHAEGRGGRTAEESARKVLPPGQEGGGDSGRDGGGRDGGGRDDRGRDGGGRDDRGRDGGGRDDRGRDGRGRDGGTPRGGPGPTEAVRDPSGGGDEADEDEGRPSEQPKDRESRRRGGEPAGQAAAADTSSAEDDEDDEAGSTSRKRRNRRDRRKRNRDRSEPAEQQPDDAGEVRAGVLDILPEGYGFLRTTGYLPGDRDVYVSQGQIRKHGLRRGDVVQGPIRQQRSNEKVPALHHVQKVNGSELEDGRVPERADFRDLTPIYPTEQLICEVDKGPSALRAIDLLAPIGRGQRALLVAPPGAGRTDLLKGLGQALARNAGDVHLMVVLIDERPEDITDVERAIPGEVISSPFNRPVEDHTQIAELAMERAKRLVELGHDVVVLVDSLTRLARAHGGGSEAGSLYPAKRFFGAARNIEGGGSLTMIAATLVDTGSQVDDRINDELSVAANAVITLDGTVEPHLRPAVDPDRSATRREELLLDDDELQVLWRLRSRLQPADGSPTLALAELLADTATNADLLDRFRDARNTSGGRDGTLAST